MFSQLLFRPEPVRMVRRAQVAVLDEMAQALGLTARAVGDQDQELAECALAKLRDLPDRMSELRRTVRAAAAVTRRSLLWQGRRAAVSSEAASAKHLDLLAGSCLLLARMATIADDGSSGMLAEQTQQLADLLGALALAPADPVVQHRVQGAVLRLARPQGAGLASPITPDVALRAIAVDILAFMGVDPGDIDGEWPSTSDGTDG